MSGIQTGAPPEQAGTAVPDQVTPTTAPTAPAAESAPAATIQVQPDTTAAFAAALESAMKPVLDQLAAVTARENARDAENRAARNRQTAAEAVTVALRDPQHADVTASIAGRVNTRITATVPTTAEGVVDVTALGEAITAAIADEATHVRRERANALAEAGVGLPYGMGGTPTQKAETDDGLEKELGELYSTLGLSESAASLAAKGR